VPFTSACSSFGLKNLKMEDKLMEEQERKYTLVVRKKRIAVSKEVYKAYYHCRNREKYLEKLAEANNISMEACNEKGIQVEYMFASVHESMEDSIVMKEMITRMLQSLALLDENEQFLINELFFNGKSERQLAFETGVLQKTINNRKRKALQKLKKFLEK